jgi:hypothetical protein
VTEKATPKTKKSEGIGGGSLRQALLVPALAVLTGLIIGAIAILASGGNVFVAYGALFSGSIGQQVKQPGCLQPFIPFQRVSLLQRLTFLPGLQWHLASVVGSSTLEQRDNSSLVPYAPHLLGTALWVCQCSSTYLWPCWQAQQAAQFGA